MKLTLSKILCGAAVLVLLLVVQTPAARADYLYTFNNPGSFSFSWSLSAPTIFTSSTGTLTNFVSVTPPSGCTISGASISAPAGSNFTVTTLFNPICGGANSVGFEMSGGPATAVGTYNGLLDTTL